MFPRTVNSKTALPVTGRQMNGWTDGQKEIEKREKKRKEGWMKGGRQERREERMR